MTRKQKPVRKPRARAAANKPRGSGATIKQRARAATSREPGVKVVKTLRAVDLMTREPITVSQEMTVADLCDLFQERNINGAPVVDEKGLLVGVVAQDDIIYGSMGRPDRDDGQPAASESEGAGRNPPGDQSPARRRRRGMVAALRGQTLRAVPDAPPRLGERAFWADLRAGDDPMRMPVRAIMTSPAISAEERTPITDLCQVMWNLRIHRVPIVRGGKVTGLISSMDLCRAILNGQIKV
jgi:CBS domain-containing protein